MAWAGDYTILSIVLPSLPLIFTPKTTTPITTTCVRWLDDVTPHYHNNKQQSTLNQKKGEMVRRLAAQTLIGTGLSAAFPQVANESSIMAAEHGVLTDHFVVELPRTINTSSDVM